LTKFPLIHNVAFEALFGEANWAERKYFTGLVQSEKWIQAFCSTHYTQQQPILNVIKTIFSLPLTSIFRAHSSIIGLHNTLRAKALFATR